MTPAGRAVALLTGAALVAGLSALTRVRWTPAGADGALVRVSFRARGERVERCRPRTQAELDALPAHMRQPVVCEAPRVAPYTLRVTIDGADVVAGPVAGSGAAGEGSLYVLRDLPVAPGPHRITVRFAREADSTATADSAAARENLRRAVPPLLALDTVIGVAPSQVVLVTYSPELRRLVLPGEGARRE